MSEELNHHKILGVQLVEFSQEHALAGLLNLMGIEGGHYAVTVNPEFLMSAEENPSFRKLLNRADLALIDGVGLLWAMEFRRNIPRWLKHMPHGWHQRMILRWMWWRSLVSFAFRSVLLQTYRKRKLPGSDLVPMLLSRLSPSDRVYIVGGEGLTAEIAQRKVERQFPHIQIVGAEEGLAELRVEDEQLILNTVEDEALCDRIEASGARLVIVAFGQVKQEAWIAQHLVRFKNVRLFIGVGGTLDFLAGNVSRSPKWLRVRGGEWLWRLIVQPWRLKRIWTAVVRFPLAVLKDTQREITLGSGEN